MTHVLVVYANIFDELLCEELMSWNCGRKNIRKIRWLLIKCKWLWKINSTTNPKAIETNSLNLTFYLFCLRSNKSNLLRQLTCFDALFVLNLCFQIHNFNNFFGSNCLKCRSVAVQPPLWEERVLLRQTSKHKKLSKNDASTEKIQNLSVELWPNRFCLIRSLAGFF